MRLKQYLTEKWFTTGKTDIWNSKKFKPLEIFINPSKGELNKISKHVRFMADDKTKKVYAWDGTIGLHSDVWNNILKKRLKDRRKYDDKTFLRAAYANGEFDPDNMDFGGNDADHQDLDEEFYNNGDYWRWVEKYIPGVEEFADYILNHSHR